MKIENGDHKATGAEVRSGLARGLGVDEATIRAFYEGELSVEDMTHVARVNGAAVSTGQTQASQPHGTSAPNVSAALAHADLRWRALIELIQDKFPPGDVVRALITCRPASSHHALSWGDFYSAAKEILAPDREFDFAVEETWLPAGKSAADLRQRFVPKKGR